MILMIAGLGMIFMVAFLGICVWSFIHYIPTTLGWGPNTAASEHGPDHPSGAASTPILWHAYCASGAVSNPKTRAFKVRCIPRENRHKFFLWLGYVICMLQHVGTVWD